jgi:LuxR family transcriptional regulator
VTELTHNPAHRVSPRLLYVGNVHEEFFRGLVVQAQQIGFEHCGYLVGIPAQGEQLQFVMLNNYPKSWQNHYRRNEYFLIDPTVQHAKANASFLVWSPSLFEHEASDTLARDARDMGFNHGWTQPLRDTSGRFGALTLSRGEGAITAEELAEKLAMMQWLALVAHGMLFRTLLARQQNELIIQLTEREIEMLHLAASGKTSGDMAKALGLSERTVNFHMSNAIQKLGAENKTQAAVLAMQMGLLE